MRDRGQGSGRAMPRKGSRMDNSNFVDKKRPKESLQYLRSSTTPMHPHSVHRCPSLLYPGHWFSLSILLGTPNTDNSLFLSIIIKMVQPILYIATAPHTLSPSLRTSTQFTTRSLSRSLPEDSVQQRFQFINTIYMSICAAPHSSRPYSLAHSLTHSLMLHPVRPFIPSPCAHNRPGPFRSICCC